MPAKSSAHRNNRLCLGAIAVAAGATALWSGSASAALVTQYFDFNTGTADGAMQIGSGASDGSAQYIDYGAEGFEAIGTSQVVATLKNPCASTDSFCDSQITPLAPGSVVGPTSAFLGSPNVGNTIVDAWYPGFGSGVAFTGYVGLQFDLDSTDTYGYATVVGSNLLSVTYDDSGDPVTVPVPEPASLALLAVGAAGIVAARRRRQTRA